MNILITGGSGFIGRHLSAQLLEEKHKVTIVDQMPTKILGVNYIKGTVMDFDTLSLALKGQEVAINLASVVGVQKNEERPAEALDVNIIGTKNVLEACRKNNVRKIIYSSSSEAYGEPIKIPIEESDSPIPITTYGIAKLAGEEYIKAYAKAYGIKYTIFRFFSVYGPDQLTDFVLPRFVANAIKNEPLIIHGDGSQIRAFCHIDDIIRGISLSLIRGDNEIINLGNDREVVSMKELAQRIIKLTNSKSELQIVPFANTERARGKEILHRVPALEKAKKLLGYAPSVQLEDGLYSVIAHLRDKK